MKKTTAILMYSVFMTVITTLALISSLILGDRMTASMVAAIGIMIMVGYIGAIVGFMSYKETKEYEKAHL